MRGERLGEPLMTAAATLAVCGSVLVACSGNCAGPVGPSDGCFPGANPVTCNAVRITITADGAYSFTANGETFEGPTKAGRSVYNVPVGTHDVVGTTSANSLTIEFGSVITNTQGVVKRGSISGVSGPGVSTTPCSVTYAIPGNGAKPQSFLARYTLYVGTDAC